ncbi:hypothetical protein C171_00170 [Pseudomonas phage YMC11/06/C171_PPU_BP]|uniref:Uncharacterized protein n=1 Tax=Pseudomonas phage YMC11/06/C171_PPU_BP TaxID=1777063 RepID=A0A127KNX2_9CAUD|nr:hypothetical protein BH776_gp17 [Pseudomonas phage YMC11/06/C171_PPU_BP]AMO43641.1 hypothetical protein C171_00170 [Pseudomonas phage YMC11/06/C171_PPU_BP]
MKPIIQWMPAAHNIYITKSGGMQSGYWACRHRRGLAYKSGVGRTPREAYEMWAQINEVRP